ncbi:alpha/beta hydrolase family protein [Rhodosalinus sp.]|uniref:alpha/beta hydrolase family protein n=1 Tax=Rhodosalinus sp. TaxID=2047741 RepID=UPI003565520A
MRPVITALGLAAGLAAAAPAAAENRIDLIRPDAPELAAPGPYPVGVTTREITKGGALDVLNVTPDARPTYDRTLTLEIWYPATDETEPGGTYTTLLRDGATEVTLRGRAARDADPAEGEAFPLIILSHGYPGNRFLMSHLGENLASKGYVVASVDHLDSTYATQAAFGSTLYNRPLDQRFVLDAMEALDGPIGTITDATRTGLVGYSMGGYGALIYAGAGLSEAATGFDWVEPTASILEPHVAGSDSHETLATDDRLDAVIAIGPWGRNAGFWDDAGLDGLRKPLLLMAGSADDVSQYGAIRQIFEEATGTDRHLLTFEAANHNAAAPIPAPDESWTPVDSLDFVPFEHYADAVWDTVRMNNVAQHFATAWMDLHLKDETGKAAYLDLVETAADGVVDLDDAGTPTDAHTYWTGFPPRSGQGLTFESRAAGE